MRVKSARKATAEIDGSSRRLVHPGVDRRFVLRSPFHLLFDRANAGEILVELMPVRRPQTALQIFRLLLHQIENRRLHAVLARTFGR